MTALNTVAIVLATLGLGGVLGYSCAHAIKTVGKMMAILLGVVFILLQVAAFYGLAQVHWDKVAQHYPSGTAIKHGASVMWKIMTYNLPFAGGFGTGFFLGMKR